VAQYTSSSTSPISALKHALLYHQQTDNKALFILKPKLVKFPPFSVHISRTQYPLTLARAATIHKVQGASLDQVVVSFEDVRTLQCGQAYVALGRAKTLNGLYIRGLTKSKIHVNKKALDEMQSMNNSRMLNWSPPTMNPAFQTSLKLVHLNCRSLKSNWQNIAKDSKLTAATILCLSETHLSRNSDNSINFDQFNIQRQDEGHGIAIASNSAVNSHVIKSLVHTQLEFVTISVSTSQTSYTVTALYRPPLPPSKSHQFLRLLADLLDSLPPSSLILGDFNVDVNNPVYPSLSHLMSAQGYKQFITQPTHRLGSILDHLYVTTCIIPKHAGVMPCSYSDHDAIFVIL